MTLKAFLLYLRLICLVPPVVHDEVIWVNQDPGSLVISVPYYDVDGSGSSKDTVSLEITSVMAAFPFALNLNTTVPSNGTLDFPLNLPSGFTGTALVINAALNDDVSTRQFSITVHVRPVASAPTYASFNVSVPFEPLKTAHTVALGASSPNAALVQCQILSLPLNGKLYQSVDGTTGAEIAVNDTVHSLSLEVSFPHMPGLNKDK